MAKVANLTAVLSADTSKFKRGLDQADVRSKRFGKDFGRVMQRAKLAVIGFAVGATAALTAMTKATFAAEDNQVKLARALGIANEEFKAMSIVASEAGVEQEKIGNAIRKLEYAIGNARRGLVTYSRAFDELGVSLSDLEGLSVDKQFELIATAMSKVEDKTQQITLAQELFGRQGLAVIDILDNYSGRLDEARQFADKFGIALSDVDAEKIELANDALGRVRMALGGLSTSIAVELAPILTGMSTKFLESGVSGQKFAESVTNGMKTVGFAIDVVRKAIAGIQLLLNGVVNQSFKMVSETSDLLVKMNEQVVSVLNLVPGVSISASDSLKDFAATMKEAVASSNQDIQNLAGQLENFESTASKIEAFKTSGEANRLSTGVKPVGTNVEEIENAEDAVNNLESKFKDLGITSDTVQTSLRSNFQQFFNQVRAGENVFTSLKNVAVNSLMNIASTAASTSIGNLLSGKGTGGILTSIGSSIIGSFFPQAKAAALAAGTIASTAVGSAYVPRDMTARIHKGEMIIPASQVGKGGGEVNINIINNSGADIKSNEKQNSNGGLDVEFIIDKAVAENIGNRASKTSKALQEYNSRGLVRR